MAMHGSNVPVFDGSLGGAAFFTFAQLYGYASFAVGKLCCTNHARIRYAMGATLWVVAGTWASTAAK